MQTLKVYQSLWATEQRIPGVPEKPYAERFDAVKAAGFDGMCVDLGSTSLDAARATIPEFRRTGLGGMLNAFPQTIEGLRPALHFAKEIGAPYVVVIGQVMPLSVEGMIPVIRAWLAMAEQEGMPILFETHRNCITNDLFTTLLLLDAIPELRLCADLSHFLLDREFVYPISAANNALMQRIMDRSETFQGRVASREQIQVAIDFPQNRKWLDQFVSWWEYGFRSWRARAGQDDTMIFLCELGPPEYAITGADGKELSDRAAEAQTLKRIAQDLWARTAPGAAPA
ncbi:sugar phosphate isomerase/epimerase family protein [Zavarzinia sp. CC-PAN008]|uniref:sugar phosphate isomerase/epimerase family protein n=1 Tax=Zavarzinia sp. CC-PAN008 TaxID=3243332 RepID=UPI003F747AC9